MTDPLGAWTGDFGAAYAERNRLSREKLDSLCEGRYGTSRTALNLEFLSGLPVTSILEVGCNNGQQLRHLRAWTSARLVGVDVRQEALDEARSMLPEAEFRRGEARALPFEGASIDLVFTSAVLIHIPPDDLGRVMEEIYRVARRWIWGLEYWSSAPVEVRYRGEDALLWKRDFVRRWLEGFPALRLVRERRLPYLREPDLVDSMYLLEKA